MPRRPFVPLWCDRFLSSPRVDEIGGPARGLLLSTFLIADPLTGRIDDHAGRPLSLDRIARRLRYTRAGGAGGSARALVGRLWDELIVAGLISTDEDGAFRVFAFSDRCAEALPARPVQAAGDLSANHNGGATAARPRTRDGPTADARRMHGGGAGDERRKLHGEGSRASETQPKPREVKRTPPTPPAGGKGSLTRSGKVRTRRVPKISTRQLESDAVLADLIREFRRRGLLEPGERGELLAWVQAEYALAHGDDPAKLFAANVRDGAWDRADAAAEDAGLKRWKRYREGADE